LFISGLDPPENISVDQSSSYSYNISWLPPSSVLPQFYDKLVYTLTIAGKSYTTSNTFFELSDIVSCDVMVNVAVRVNSLGYISNDSYLPFNFSSCGNSDSSSDSSLPSLTKTLDSTYSSESKLSTVHQSILEPSNIGPPTLAILTTTPDSSNQSIMESTSIGSTTPMKTPDIDGDKPVTPIVIIIAVVGIIAVAVIVVGSVVVIIISIISGIYCAYKHRQRNRAAVNSIELLNRSKISQQPEMESTTQSQNKKIDTASRGEKAPVHNVTPPPDTNTLTNNDSKDNYYERENPTLYYPALYDPDSDNEHINRFPGMPCSLVDNGNDSNGGGGVISSFNPPFEVHVIEDNYRGDNI
jgi:hypothetical protein